MIYVSEMDVINATITFKDSMMLLMIGLFMSVMNVVGLILMKVNMNKINVLKGGSMCIFTMKCITVTII